MYSIFFIILAERVSLSQKEVSHARNAEKSVKGLKTLKFHSGKSCMTKGQSSISTFVGVGAKRKLDYIDNLSETDDTIESIPNKIQETLAPIPLISENV